MSNLLNSHDELMKLIIQNQTNSILKEYQSNIQKDFEKSFQNTIGLIQNISKITTKPKTLHYNYRYNNKNNKNNNIIHNNKKIIAHNKDNIIRKTNLQKQIPKKWETKKTNIIKPAKADISELNSRDSLEDEDSFDSMPTSKKNLKKKSNELKKTNNKQVFTDDFLDP